MTKELKKRTITSIVLFFFAIFCIFINPIIFMIALFIISYLAFYEASFLIYPLIRRITIWR